MTTLGLAKHLGAKIGGSRRSLTPKRDEDWPEMTTRMSPPDLPFRFILTTLLTPVQ